MRSCRPWYVLALAGYFGLFAWLMLWFAVLAPPARTPVAIALLFAGLLLLPLRGLLHGRAYTYAWTSLLTILYFIHGVVVAWSVEAERLWASIEIVLSLTLFSGSVLYARCHGRAAKHRGVGGEEG